MNVRNIVGIEAEIVIDLGTMEALEIHRRVNANMPDDAITWIVDLELFVAK